MIAKLAELQDVADKFDFERREKQIPETSVLAISIAWIGFFLDPSPHQHQQVWEELEKPM